jgi:hypothetical protein
MHPPTHLPAYRALSQHLARPHRRRSLVHNQVPYLQLLEPRVEHNSRTRSADTKQHRRSTFPKFNWRNGRNKYSVPPSLFPLSLPVC